MDSYFLYGKHEKITFQVPDTWSVLNNVVPKPTKPDLSLNQMIEKALTEPIGTPPLANLIKATDKIVIILDDFTRPTPKTAILNCLVDHVRQLGVGLDQIDILFGLGTHHPVAENEAREALGPDLFDKLRWTNHDSRSSKLISVGTSSLYGQLKVNPLLPAADFRIAVGSVLPHPMAGFGGGAKLVMPGVSNFEFIRQHHLTTFLPRLDYGETEDNSCCTGICEAARMAGLDFIVNTVYNAEHEVKAVVAGDFEKAHKNGVQMSLKEYGVKVAPPADVSIVSVFPYFEGSQVIKPLIPGALVTKEGGTIILFASAIHGGRLPAPFLDIFDDVWAQVDDDPAKTAMEFIKKDKLIAPDGPLDFNAAVYLNLLILSRVKVLFASKDVSADQAKRMGFDYAPTIEEAIKMVSARLPNATVNILPSGGMVVPFVEEPLTFS